jgi:hypothetical protein
MPVDGRSAMTDEELRYAAVAIANSIGARLKSYDDATAAIVAIARRYAASQRTAALALAGKWRAMASGRYVRDAADLLACADELAALFPEVTRG